MKGKINLLKRAGTDCTIIELVKCIYPINKKKLHNYINSITILFHPKGLITYSDVFSILWQKVNMICVEMIAGIK